MFRAGRHGYAAARRAAVAFGVVFAASMVVMPWAAAHPGGTDKYGCHAGTQPYHCHNADGTITYPDSDFSSGGSSGGSVGPGDPPSVDTSPPVATTPPPDTSAPLTPRIVKWFIKGAILTIIFSGDDDSHIDIVSSVDGVIDTLASSVAEQQVEVALGPDEQDITLVATDAAGNVSRSEPMAIAAEESLPADDGQQSGATPAASNRDDGGDSGPNLLVIAGPIVASAALVGGTVLVVRRRRRTRVTSDLGGDTWDNVTESAPGRGPLDPPGDF